MNSTVLQISPHTQSDHRLPIKLSRNSKLKIHSTNPIRLPSVVTALCHHPLHYQAMYISTLALTSVLFTLTTALPQVVCPRNDVEALARYEVQCIGGPGFPYCYEGGAAGCRCDSYGTYLCQDRDCQANCECQRYV